MQTYGVEHRLITLSDTSCLRPLDRMAMAGFNRQQRWPIWLRTAVRDGRNRDLAESFCCDIDESLSIVTRRPMLRRNDLEGR